MREEDIIRGLLDRDSQAMDWLLEGYGPLMRYVMMPIIKNPQDQEDCPFRGGHAGLGENRPV